MNQSLYRKGVRLIWIGLLGSAAFLILANLGKIVSTGPQEALPALAPYSPIFRILAIVLAPISIWGIILVLKSKNRSLAWIIPILFLGLIGLIILFSLKDKTLASVQSATQPKPPSNPQSPGA